MLINRLIRYIFGYVIFSFYGAFPERFITLAGQSGIEIWDTYCRQGVCYSHIARADYKLLKPIAAKCGIRLRAVEQIGLPLFLNKYKHRIGMGIGMAVFALILIINSQYIWTVKIVGCEQLSEQTVLEAMEELGVYSGAKRSDIDYRMTSERARLMLPDVSWIYVNLNGCLAQIELSERTYAPDIADGYCNIIASQDGQIASIEGYSGQTAVKVGDGVAKGDLLISGVVTDQYGKSVFTRASGKIMAVTERNIEIKTPFLQSRYQPTGRIKQRRTLRFLGAQIPLSIGGEPAFDCTMDEEQKCLRIYGEDMPICLNKQIFSEIEEIQYELTQEQALKKAYAELDEYKKNELTGREILDERAEEIINEDGVTLKVKIVCKENIAVQQKFIVN